MTSGNPRVSVVIPAYNSAEYTVETVESVLAQTYENVEIIVVDDGSTDDTRAAMEQYGNTIQYIYKDNGGACSARNVGIGIATGDYIAFLDCDDLWSSEKLEHSLSALEGAPEAAFVFTRCQLIDDIGGVIGEVDGLCRSGAGTYMDILMGKAVPAPTVVIRKENLDRVGSFDEKIFIPADKDLWLRLARDSSVCYVDLPLSQYRVTSSYTLRNIDMALRENVYVLEKQFANEEVLDARLRKKILQENLFVHAMLYRSMGDVGNARDALWRAFIQGPFNSRVMINLVFSFCGMRIWDGVATMRRLLRRRGI